MSHACRSPVKASAALDPKIALTVARAAIGDRQRRWSRPKRQPASVRVPALRLATHMGDVLAHPFVTVTL